MKAISLLSGGLDSQLAVRLIQEQGIEVIGLNFVSPFFGGGEEARKAARALKIQVLFPEVGNAYMELLKNPAHGFGKNYNPCIDCHAFMLRRAGEMLEELGASFIVTGEVLGQRPMSQNRNALKQVEKTSGMDGLVVRPLSALKLAETIPEQKGWLDRAKLLDIQGRGRTRQIELAAALGLKEYPTPAGGCLLTQESTAKRIRRYFAFRPDVAELHELDVMKAGRHFYPDENTLLVVGRHQADNQTLTGIAREGDCYLKVANHPGPLALLRCAGNRTDAALETAARTVARYSDAKADEEVPVKLLDADMQLLSMLHVRPYKPMEIPDSVS